MPGETPSETFAEAQQAVAAGDWEALFACLDRRSLIMIARNALALALQGGAQGLSAIPGMEAALEGEDPWLAEWMDRQEAMIESARSLMAIESGPEMMEASTRHRDLVQEDDAKTKAALERFDGLPGLVGALERQTRKTSGGGSVSSDLFAGDTLEEVKERGKRARAVRRTERGYEDEIVFTKAEDRWYIHIG